jgi:hypothetical protein
MIMLMNVTTSAGCSAYPLYWLHRTDRTFRG